MRKHDACLLFFAERLGERQAPVFPMKAQCLPGLGDRKSGNEHEVKLSQANRLRHPLQNVLSLETLL
jgi:hypothetical protein